MKIIIVDDHPLVRQGLHSVLALDEEFQIIGECTNSKEAIDLIKAKDPEIALVDLRLGKENGLDIVSAVKKANNRCKFIILTSSASYSDFMMAENRDVDGYVLKEALPEELIYAIRMVSRGRKYYDPVLLEYKLRDHDSEHDNDQLTARELEVLKELGKGLTNQQIAARLFITAHTVKKHVSQILAKLSLDDRTQAALYVQNKDLQSML